MTRLPIDFNALPSHLKIFIRDNGKKVYDGKGIRIYEFNGYDYKQKI